MLTDPKGTEYSSTDGLYITLDLNINSKNDIIFEIINRDPFEDILQKEPLLATGEIEKQLEDLKRRNLIPRDRGIMPTCAERVEDGQLVVLWRLTPKYIGGGDCYPFLDRDTAFLVKGHTISEILVDRYGREKLLTRDAKLIVGDYGTKNINPDIVNSIMLYESLPSAYSGYLSKAYKEIEKLQNLK